jgi:hypothetical protein
MKHFYPVWISSIEHLNSVFNHYKNQSKWRKIFGFFKFPQSTACFSFKKFFKLLSLFILIVLILNWFLLFFIPSPIYLWFTNTLFLVSFTYIAMYSILNRAPIVFFSSGTLYVEKEKITFNANPIKKGVLQFHNIMKNLEFQLKPDEIETIDRYQHPEAPFKKYNLIWIRISTKENIIGGEFLMCIGKFRVFMRKRREKNEEFFKKLVDFKT